MTVLIVGDVLTDTVVQLHAPLRPGGDAASTISDSPGGQGANVARWMVAAGATDVRLVAAVSTHDPVDHAGLLAAAGITPLFASIDAPVARIVVIVEPHGVERSFLTQRGAGAMLNASFIDRVDLTGVQWCHVSGYLFASEEGRQCYARLHSRCSEKRIPISVDPASTSELLSIGPKQFLELVGRVNLLTPNDAEALVLTGSREPGSAARQLLQHADAVVVTCGADGVTATSTDTGPIRLAAEPTPVIDPTGAGDAFAAGFITSMISGHSFAAALQSGVALAAKAVSAVGAAPN